MRSLALLWVTLAIYALAGCDLIGGSSETAVYGRVVDGESGEPLNGFRVAFVRSVGYAGYATVASTTTDAQGRFELSFQYEGQNWPAVWVNHLGVMERGCYYITHAGTSGPSVEPGRRTEVNVVLPRNSYYDPAGNPGGYPSPVECITDFG